MKVFGLNVNIVESGLVIIMMYIISWLAACFLVFGICLCRDSSFLRNNNKITICTIFILCPIIIDLIVVDWLNRNNYGRYLWR